MRRKIGFLIWGLATVLIIAKFSSASNNRTAGTPHDLIGLQSLSETDEIPLCGDVNCDLIINLVDVVVLVEYHFSRSAVVPCPEHGGGDVNADGCYSFLDVICLIVYFFQSNECIGECAPGIPPPCGPCPDAGEPDVMYLTPAAGFPGDQVNVGIYAWTDLVLIDPYCEVPLILDSRLNFVSGQYRDGTAFEAYSDSTIVLWGGGPVDYKFLILGGITPHPVSLLMATMTVEIDPLAIPGEAYIDSTFIEPAHIIAFYDFNDPHFGCSTPLDFDRGVVTIYSDTDGDRVRDEDDNCPTDYNPDQEDNDEDGVGNACDDCDCGFRFGDVNCDDAVNPVDVVYMVNYAYKALDGRCYPSYWNCDYEIGDVNCDSAVNPVDVVYYVNMAYKSQDAFCYPCGP